jgi:hypothetical protein
VAILAAAIVVLLLQQAPVTLNRQWGAVLQGDQALVFATTRLCNRPGTGAAEATWTPDAETIRRLESVLAPQLQAAIDLQSDPAKRLLATDFYRQYAGLVIAGRRIVYINGLHSSTVQRDPTDSWQTIAARPCDGGLRFFGAEYDVATGGIAKIFFNGGGRGARPWHTGSSKGEVLPDDLSALLSRTPYEGRLETWCRVAFDSSGPAAFAVALATARGKVYATVGGDAQIVVLAEFRGGSDLACYTRREAEKLDASIRDSEGMHGSVTPRWDSTVICGFVEDTMAVCWQFAPDERTFVRVGRWTT